MERKREEVTTGTPVMRAAGTLLVAREVKYSGWDFPVCLERNKGEEESNQGAERSGCRVGGRGEKGKGKGKGKRTRVGDSRDHEGELRNLVVVVGR